jgi:2-isopropylmalate synthase
MKSFIPFAEGNGPVNALDAALRKALLRFYPALSTIELVDYKVRILEENSGTASQVRVLIESSRREKRLAHRRQFQQYYRS